MHQISLNQSITCINVSTVRWKWAGLCLMMIPLGIPSLDNSLFSKPVRSRAETSSAVNLCSA